MGPCEARSALCMGTRHREIDAVSTLKHCNKNPASAGFSFGAPGRAHLLGGGSPLHTRHGEVLAERQGCRGRLRIWRKPKAKRWPDEQEADRRQCSGVSRPISVKPDTCTERCAVYPTGISVKVSASYPGRSEALPRASDVERRRDGASEVSRGHSRWRHRRAEPEVPRVGGGDTCESMTAEANRTDEAYVSEAGRYLVRLA